MSPALEYVDLFPTRYEAFDKPGTWCVFQPTLDGSFWHCRRDGKRSDMRDFIAPKCSELAVLYSGDGGPYAEVRAGRKGGFSVEVQQANWGRHLSGFATIGAAIRAACADLGLDVPAECPL